MNDPREIPCDHVIAQLWEYLDGDLEGESAEGIQRHLDLCARRFPEYDFRRAYLRFMRRCSSQPVPPDLRRRVFETILAEERQPPPPSPADWPGLGRALRRLFGR
jgi:anti-sigma factor (TIGR02949 family)